jgi:hypothetical protein
MAIRNRLLVRVSLWGVLVTALSACSSGGSNGNNPAVAGTQCNPGTQLALASPNPNQTGVPTSTNQIVVVANGNANYLYQTYANWQVVLLINNNPNQAIPGGTLALVNDNSGPHPFPSDYYYASSISGLVPGAGYAVYLNQTNSGCNLIGPIGGFST